MDRTELFKPLESLLDELKLLLLKIDHQQYAASLEVLGGSSVGQHYRHVMEFFKELHNGYGAGVVCYDRRERNRKLETDKDLAVAELSKIRDGLYLPDKPLMLSSSFPETGIDEVVIQTNYYRELLYNLEHVVHHMALIRIGTTALGDIPLGDNFGIAESTIQMRKQCAQ